MENKEIIKNKENIRNKKNNKTKYILNMIIMFIVIFIILYFTLKDDFNEVMTNIKKMNIFYLLIGIILMVLYRFFLGISMYIVAKCNKQKYKFTKLN